MGSQQVQRENFNLERSQLIRPIIDLIFVSFSHSHNSGIYHDVNIIIIMIIFMLHYCLLAAPTSLSFQKARVVFHLIT